VAAEEDSMAAVAVMAAADTGNQTLFVGEVETAVSILADSRFC
jgi:hypothetical protein